MAAKENQKRKISPSFEQRDGLRKSVKTRRSEIQCPVCDVTLWPETIEQHYKMELDKLSGTSPSLTHTKKKKKRKSSSKDGKNHSREKDLFQNSLQVLESVRRRHVLFNQRPNFHVPSLGAGPSTSGSQICPVCDKSLPEGVSAAQTHVNQCLGVEDAGEQEEEEEEGSTDSETYEEYTWCNVTRVRATSMLSPEARANMFDGTVISKGDVSLDHEVDVEEDETEIYGPAQFEEKDIQVCGKLEEEGERDKEKEEEPPAALGVKRSQQCLICMDSYHNPLVSIKCWHVYCENCWLQALRTKKLCPKCKNITSSSDLRKIYL